MHFAQQYNEIKKNYRSLKLIEKLVVWMRFKFAPFEEIERAIPSRGKLLDLGCGYGVYSYFLALRHPYLYILGIDPSGERIERAQNVFLKPENLEFRQGRINELGEAVFDAIILTDVIYYLSEEQQSELIKLCQEKLKNDGVLIIKTMSKDDHFKYLLMTFIAKINTIIARLAGLLPKFKAFSRNTFGERTILPIFYHSSEFAQILKNTGWQVEINDNVSASDMHPSVLFICRKVR
jgi:2-polyprenyl-3-methyl-5-hydroxy-6-metoxy-1,4-benzoquinol methylase